MALCIGRDKLKACTFKGRDDTMAEQMRRRAESTKPQCGFVLSALSVLSGLQPCG